MLCSYTHRSPPAFRSLHLDGAACPSPMEHSDSSWQHLPLIRDQPCIRQNPPAPPKQLLPWQCADTRLAQGVGTLGGVCRAETCVCVAVGMMRDVVCVSPHPGLAVPIWAGRLWGVCPECLLCCQRGNQHPCRLSSPPATLRPSPSAQPAEDQTSRPLGLKLSSSAGHPGALGCPQ